MLGEILKAIELVLTTIQGMPVAARRRKRVVRALKQLYLAIDSLATVGDELIAIAKLQLESDDILGNVESDRLIRALTKKDERIRAVLRILQDESISVVVQIHLPEFSGLKGMLHQKRVGVAFLLAQLTLPQGPGQDEIMRYEHTKEQSLSEYLRRLKEDMNSRGLHGYPASAFEDYEMDLWYLNREVDRRYGRYHYSYIFATHQEVEELERIINRIRTANDTLREMLKTFGLDELI